MTGQEITNALKQMYEAERHPYQYLGDCLSVITAGHVCRYCMNQFKDLAQRRRCSGCSRVWYCSTECQGKDWDFMHKQECRKWKKLEKMIRGQASKFQPVMQHAHTDHDHDHIGPLRMIRSLDINQRLPPGPLNQLIQRESDNEVRCASCLMTPFETEKYLNLTPCSNCGLAWYCSQKCADRFPEPFFHPPETCKRYREQAALQHVLIGYSIAMREPTKSLLFMLEDARSQYQPLSSLRGWEDYHVIDPTLDTRVAELLPTYQHLHPDAHQGLRDVALESLSLAMTVLSALEDTIPDLATCTFLCIHIVGAARREAICRQAMEQILHMLPSLQNLRLLFVGPNLLHPDIHLNLDLKEYGNNHACQTCSSAGRERLEILAPLLYHQLVDNDALRDKFYPDLVVLPNSGCSEAQMDSWLPTLRYLLDSDFPILMTAYTEPECRDEEKYVKKLGGKIVKGPTYNKWRGKEQVTAMDLLISRPYLDTVIVGYASHWCLIAQGRA